MDTYENNENMQELLSPAELTEEATPESVCEAADLPELQPEPVCESAPVIQAEPQPEPQAAKPVRRESPYANSPYVMQHAAPEAPPARPAKPSGANKKKKHFGRKWIAAILVLALVIGSSCVTAALVNARWEDALEKTEKAFSDQISHLQQQIASTENKANAFAGGSVSAGEALSPAQVYAQNVDSVVAISATIQASYFGQITEGASSGSGFVLTANGYVVTNYHVVENASRVEVITHDGMEHAATIVGFDSTNDVALLKVEDAELSPVTLGVSSNLIIGDMVVAIGNPLGELTSTQTVGYVSGIGREVSTDSLTTISMIQTDAAINPGNSGGPLFNMRGEVVGITTAKYSGTTESGASIEGIGFAIPIDDVMSMLSDLMDYGYVTGAYLGVSVRNTDPAVTSMYGLPDGAQVVEVVEGVCAHRAGVQVNDIITALGEYEVTNVTTLTRALRNFKAGDVTTITVVRSGVEKVLTITLDEKPRDLTTTVPDNSMMPNEGSYDEWFDYFFGN